MKDLNPLVSVVIPVGHLDHFLQESLESVANSTYSNYEVVLVCPPHIHTQVFGVANEVFRDIPHVVLCETGKGLPAALNQAISAASGEYIARMDADDISYPARLGAQVAYFGKNPNVSVLGTQITYICQHNHVKGISRYPNRISKRGIWKNSGTPIAHPTAMFRKSDFVNIGKYNTRYEVCEDQELWFRFLKSGDLANLKSPLVSYRQHPGQISEYLQTKIRGYSLIAFIANGLIPCSNRHRAEEMLVSIFESGGIEELCDSLPNLRNDLAFMMYFQTKWLVGKAHLENSLQKLVSKVRNSKNGASKAVFLGEFLVLAFRYPIHTLSFAGENLAHHLRSESNNRKFKNCSQCSRSLKN